MKKVLVISNEFSFCKEINNNMVEGCRLTNISDSFEEGVTNIINLQPDIIVLELEVQYYKILFMMSQIEKLKLYNPTVIIISDLDLCYITEKYSNCVVVTRMKKLHLLLFRIFKCIEENVPDNVIENRILEEMHKLGFEMKNKGDYLILKTLKYIKTHNNIGTNLEKDVYPNISKVLNTEERKIKWNINYSINSLYEAKPYQVCNYLHIDVNEKPTTKYVILSIVNNI